MMLSSSEGIQLGVMSTESTEESYETRRLQKFI